MIRIIVAHDQNLAIGIQGKLPWPRLAKDMEQFKRLTLGGTVVMGRKTYESIGHALTGRRNIVLSRLLKVLPEAEVTSDFEKLLEISSVEDIWVIGGSEIYKIFLPHAAELYVTAIQEGFKDTNVFFLQYKQQFELVDESEVISESDLEYTFQRFQKR